jgi:hypothetical protein
MQMNFVTPATFLKKKARFLEFGFKKKEIWQYMTADEMKPGLLLFLAVDGAWGT